MDEVDKALEGAHWVRLPRPEDDLVRAENRAARGLTGWYPIRLEGRTRLGRPNMNGWLILALAVLLVTLILGNGLSRGDAAGTFILAALVVAAALAVVVTFPPLHESETATWILTATSEKFRLERKPKESVPQVQEMNRAEAGRLEVRIDRVGSGRYEEWKLRWAVGHSIDDSALIEAPALSFATGGLCGHLDRVDLAMALVSWWPANRRSDEALRAFEQAGLEYWNPSDFGWASWGRHRRLRYRRPIGRRHRRVPTDRPRTDPLGR